MEGVDTHAGCSEDILTYVIDEDSFVWNGADFSQRMVINRRRGFARSYAAGVDARGEVANKWVRGLDMRHVDGIGIREQGEAAFCCQMFEQELWQDRGGIENAIPNRAEFFKAVRKTEFFREVGVPVARRHAAFLPIRPAHIRLQFPQNLHMVQAVAFAERSHGTRQIDADDDPADVKDHGARRFVDGRT